jgi:archaellum component FlaG (FlaF/FlaG flagellin family)
MRIVFWIYAVRISAVTRAVLTEVTHDFPQFLQDVNYATAASYKIPFISSLNSNLFTHTVEHGYLLWRLGK